MSMLPDVDKLPKSISPDLDLDKIKRDCEALVNEKAKISAGAAIIPIPLVDLVVDGTLLTHLLPEISQRFGLIEQNQAMNLDSDTASHFKDRAMSFAGLMFTRGLVRKTISGFGGRLVAQHVTKLVPFGGQLVSATMGYLIFKKIAADHINECYETAKRLQNSQNARTVN